MEKKELKKKQESQAVKESLCEYQSKLVPEGITRLITQDKLDKECMTIEKSKALILEKVYSYFHHS